MSRHPIDAQDDRNDFDLFVRVPNKPGPLSDPARR
jgi:hypothetical protein